MEEDGYLGRDIRRCNFISRNEDQMWTLFLEAGNQPSIRKTPKERIIKKGGGSFRFINASEGPRKTAKDKMEEEMIFDWTIHLIRLLLIERHSLNFIFTWATLNRQGRGTRPCTHAFHAIKMWSLPLLKTPNSKVTIWSFPGYFRGD